VEKAHPEAFNMLLQIMEEGQLSDAKGRRVDFRNTLIIMTSNVGVNQLNRHAALGFDRPQTDDTARQDYEAMCDKVLTELKRMFKPEFLNRVDKIIVFHPLTRDDLRKIVNIQVSRLDERLEAQRLSLEVTDAARDRLAAEGYEPEFGARPLRRAIVNLIEDPLAEKLLTGEVAAGDRVTVDLEGDMVVIRPAATAARDSAEPASETEPASGAEPDESQDPPQD
jgi:ATP-dependent Clp protease ATP-binding subunit ClpC